MHKRVANTGDPRLDWEDQGPSSPMPCGPSGIRHTSDSRDIRGEEATLYGMTFPHGKGERPMQLPLNVSIETSYDG